MNVIEKKRQRTAPAARKTGKTGKNKAVAASTEADPGGAADVTGVAAQPGGRDVLVALDRLVLSEANVRTVTRPEGLSELAALISAQGLLQRLSVVEQADGHFAVVAGGRRWRAMQLLVEQGIWPADHLVECKAYPSAQAVQVSLAENSGREVMHPADQMAAFRRLIEAEGLTVAQVAGRFGMSPLTVERRLKLARLAPRFIDLYRADAIEPDQLQALALTDDHAAQEAVWEGLPSHDRSAYRIRHALTAQACSADSKLGRFVGLDAYEAEGGAVRRDLFATPDDLRAIYLESPALLQTLAMDKLRGHMAAVKAEGWAWVDCALDADGALLRAYGREDESEREPTAEEAQAIEGLTAEHLRHLEAYDQHQEEGDPEAEDYELVEQQLCNALEQAEAALNAAHAALRQWSPEQMARAGALVRLDHRGALAVDRGLLRREDGQAMHHCAHASGSGTSSAAARSPARPAFSEKLMRDLTAHRTAAIQAALLQNPRVALVALVHRMAETVFGVYGRGDDVVRVTVRVTGDSTLAQDASDYATSPAATLLGEAEGQWGDRLPGQPSALFRWLLAQPDETLMELLAYCTARSVNAVVPRERIANHSDALVEALGVDMADWWLPTAATYLASVSKVKALEAVREATGFDATGTTVGMKKAEVVAYCTSKLNGTRWLPEPLRVRATADTALDTEQVPD